jgi:hypothetical protein
MSNLLISEIDGIPIYFKETKPVKELFAGRHVVFLDDKTKVFYYVREKPGHIKTGTKFASIYTMVNEAPELTEYFSVTEEIFSATVLRGNQLMVLIKGPEVNYIKAMLLQTTADPQKSWDHPDKFIGFVTPKDSVKRSYMFKTSEAILVKSDDN